MEAVTTDSGSRGGPTGVLSACLFAFSRTWRNAVVAIALVLPAAPAWADCSTDPATFLNVVTHHATSYCELCGEGTVRIVLTNPDSQQLTNITVTEDLGSSGLEYVPGSSIVGGTAYPAQDPAVPLTWTAAEYAELASLAGSSSMEVVFRVRRTAGTEEGLASLPLADRRARATADFDFAECPVVPPTPPNPPWGTTTKSTGWDLLLLNEPIPTVTKLGRNVDAAQASYTNPVYGNTDDDVIWRIQISNGGLAAMQDVIFSDLMTAGNMNVNWACPTEGDALTIANSSGASVPGTCVAASNSLSAFSATNIFPNPAVAAGGNASVYLVGKVTASCSNRDNTVSNVEWGCQTGATGNGGITTTSTGVTPAASSATMSAQVVGGNLQVTRQITGINGGALGTRGIVTLTITNNNSGGTVKDIHLQNILPAGYVVDPSYTPVSNFTYAYGTRPAGGVNVVTWSNPAGGTAAASLASEANFLANTQPEFDFTSTDQNGAATYSNMLRNGDMARVIFRIVLINGTYYDKAADLDITPETGGTSTDPAAMPLSTNTLNVTYTDFCSGTPTTLPSFVDNVTPNPEDLDISFNAPLYIITNDPAYPVPITVQLTNNGGDTAADWYAYVSFGEEMTVTAVPAGCATTTNLPPRPVWPLPTGGPPPIPASATVYQCTGTGINNGSPRTLTFQVTKNAAAATDDLFLRADVIGEIHLSNGATLVYPAPSDPIGSTTNNYTLDAVRSRALGFNLTKAQQGTCSENPPAGTPDLNVQIGEECGFHIESGGWFGFQTPGFNFIAVRNITVTDQVPNGQGFLTQDSSASDSGPGGITAPVVTSTQLASGSDVSWSFNPTGNEITTKDKFFRTDVSTRVLNDPVDSSAAPNQHAAQSRNIAVTQFDAVFDTTTITVDETTGVPGYPVQAVRRVDLTVMEPNITVVKQVCNETLYGTGPSCSNWTTLASNGDTNDSYIYRIRLTNGATASGVARAPAYNVVATDALDSSDLMRIVQSNGNPVNPFQNDNLDNDGDGLTDEADEGTFNDNTLENGIPAVITFSHTHSTALQRVDPDTSVDLYYRIDPSDNIAPLQTLTNTVTMTYDSLAGDYGNQTAPQGSNGQLTGARVYTTTAAQARVRILPLQTQPKSVTAVSNTALGGSPQSVSVGEEVRYQLTSEIPVSYLRNLVIRDELPAGIRCVEAQALDLSPTGPHGAAGFRDASGNPVYTAITPTCTGTGSSDYVEWNIGNVSVTTAPGVRYNLPVTFVARVENSAVVNNIITLNGGVITNPTAPNRAYVRYNNQSGATITLDFASAGIRVREPDIALTKTFSAATTDAGDVLTVTVTATNTGTATAYNLRVLDDLVGRKLTFLNSVSGTDPPDNIDTATLGANRPIFSWNATNPDYAIAPGASKSFTFTVSVDIDVEPQEVLSNTLQASWQSLPGQTTALNSGGLIGADGSIDGLRNGAIPNVGDAINHYETTASANVTVAAVTIAKNRRSDTYSPGNTVRIGDIIEYELRLNLIEGTTSNIVLTDVLPQGLQYESTVSVNGDTAAPYTSIAPFTFGSFAGASVAGDATTGPTTLTWNLGTVVNAGDNNTGNNDFVIVYRARVLNAVHPQVANIALVNNASFDYTVASVAAPTLSDNETVNVVQPNITVTKSATPAGGDTVLDAGEIVDYTVDIANTGTAPAYDVVLRDIIPVGLRNGAATVTTQSVSLVVAGTTRPSLAPSYDAATGVAVWNFDAGGANQYTIPAGDTLRLVYRVQADTTLSAAMVMTNQAQVQNYYSFDDEAVPAMGGISGVREIYGVSNASTVTLTTAAPNPPLKQNPASTSVNVGETFSWTVTVPAAAQTTALHDVVIYDTLPSDLTLVSIDRVSGPGTWTPVNTGTATSLVIQDTVNGIDIPAGQQVQVRITVRVANTGTNVDGRTFSNTASYRYNQINGDIGTQQNGGSSTTPNMTVVEPATMAMNKTGPAQVQFGVPATFTLNLQNTGTGRAWDLTITDQLPNPATGGMCDTPPSGFTAGIYDAPGTTLIRALTENTDYVTSFTGAPTCTLSITMQSAAAAFDPTQRLIVTYQATPDNDNTQGVSLTNIAGATQWFSQDTAGAGATGDTRSYTEVLSTGTTGDMTDHEDAATVTTEVPRFRFSKSVVNLTTSQNPGSNASPGDTLRYTVSARNLSTIALGNFRLTDEVDRLSGGTAVFAPGTLTNIGVTGGGGSVDTSSTNASGGTLGTGLLDVRGLSLDAAGGANDTVTITFDVTLASSIANGTAVLNQAQILVPDYTTLDSDDPNISGDDNPLVLGDEDPTRTTITSAPSMQVRKVSQDLTGDPAVLLSGDTLRYTITVKNTGNENLVSATLRDWVPANTTYVANTTRLNGSLVADPSPGVSALQAGMAINAPENTTAGFLRADASATTGNVATITFDVTIDAGAINGTLISNQGFVNGNGAGGSAIAEQASDDPATAVANDPTVDIVGNLPLIDAQKTVSIVIDGGTTGQVDAGDTLLYTITVTNNGASPATGVVITDTMPSNTTYVGGSGQLNGAGTGISFAGTTLTADYAGTFGNLAVGATATVTFRVLVAGTVVPGDIISNQGSVASNEQAAEPTDADGIDSNGDQPTQIVVGNAQALTVGKSVAVVGGGTADAGAQLEYTVQVSNIGAVAASNVVLTDGVPANTTYVANSVTLDGIAVADPGPGVSPLVAGMPVSSSDLTPPLPTVGNGTISIGGSATVRFRVQINPATPIGTTISNTANLTWGATGAANASVAIDVGGTPGVANLNGRLWHDADFGNDVDAAERRLQNWSVDIYRNGTLFDTRTTDANGVYAINGLAPNDVSGVAYELRFRAPGAGANSASLGLADSVFTNGPQRISSIVVGSGANAQNLNLPIDPDGVVYNSVSRAAVAGATLRMLQGGAALPAACFDDTVQQGQVTLADGYYKFDLNFGNPGCTAVAGGNFVIEVTPPASGYVAGASLIIPPLSSATTAAYSVPACSADAITPTPAGFCEAQASEFAPPAAAPSTAHYLHLTLNNPQPGSSQLFNNHIPVDPVIAATGVTITKTTPQKNVTRGALVPYTLTVTNNLGGAIANNDIIDTMPPGFKYVPGSARINGVKQEPTVNGRTLTWPNLTLPATGNTTVKLLLVIGTGVSEGEYVNQAQVYNSLFATFSSGIATATVRVIPDPTFDCSDIIGKVFDDRNANGIQDAGEKGLAGVRVTTATGLLTTADKHGRFHITCAAVPNIDRGSNFILKLDTRTLPTGYRVTSENPRVQRVTRGKMVKFNFGATIHRVVRLDISDGAFQPVRTALRPEWTASIDDVIKQLKQGPSVLRIAYVGDAETGALAKARLKAIADDLRKRWKDARGAYVLTVETELFWRRGRPGGQ